jgi:hypothetical protein
MVCFVLNAQEHGSAQDSGMAEMMKKWMDAATPGDAHKKLGDLVGSWDITTSMYMGGPETEPSISKGSAEIIWIMGGRFISQDVKSEMMGMPMTGLGITGYDNMNRKYVSFWIDNTGTGMYTAAGHFNEDGTVLSLYGTTDEPMTGEHGKNVKYVTRFISKDKFVHEIHDLAIGEPNTLVVKIVYERKK